MKNNMEQYKLKNYVKRAALCKEIVDKFAILWYNIV